MHWGQIGDQTLISLSHSLILNQVPVNLFILSWIKTLIAFWIRFADAAKLKEAINVDAKGGWLSSYTMELGCRRCHSQTLQNGYCLPSSQVHRAAALQYAKCIHSVSTVITWSKSPTSLSWNTAIAHERSPLSNIATP